MALPPIVDESIVRGSGEERRGPASLEPAAGARPEPAAPAGQPTTVVPPIEAHPLAPTGVVAQVLAAAITGVTAVVQPEAAVAVAGQFTFPIALTVAVLAFIAVQGHIDRRDPKLRMAPQHVVETVVRFEPEDDL